MKILVTGTTGYVGSKLVPKLIEAGHEVVCMVRDSSRAGLLAFDGARFVQADALDEATLPPVLAGMDVAYYLIHSLGDEKAGFAERDRQAAHNFAAASKRAGVRRIIYLGGLTSKTSTVSQHLKSRQETGAVLRRFGPPLTEFRAGIIVGNGSVSFEMIRYLTERLPVMICPRWVMTRTQPIAIGNVIEYLVAALDVPDSTGEIIEIGGATVETYRSMMLTYARARGLRRGLIRVPVLTPRLSSYWLNLFTPVPASIARPLIEGLRTEVVCTTLSAGKLFPWIHPISYRAAIEAAAERPVPDESLQRMIPENTEHICLRREGLICDAGQTAVHAPAEQVFAVLQRLGGERGWLYANALWQLRGWMDALLGGVGMRRNGSREGELKAGDALDFWRVAEVSRFKGLLLRAEMKLPGRAWLQFQLTRVTANETRLRCCAWFEPRGMAGELYWWLLYPIHRLIFRGMLMAIQRQSEKGLSTAGAPAVQHN
jgi:uncharacterized protein YbjT (DUF2867 family)